ncbi:hypothetical protein HYFRA_00005196 [Hymenoscyphus fraxineus]|uniref:Uncharacterized protein n=1 Tax=Hymenoscyphus fraxineus TaxID=746836 RepID=A0A9N9Q069_9HELO|nr:hypothetical protein HYFRA_00005196 [Hymenoscyphus fraxineus]
MNRFLLIRGAQRCTRIFNVPSRRSKHEDMLQRDPVYIFDDLSPTHSHLLNITLADFLPPKYHAPGFQASNLPLSRHATPLPPGHHLVYFPPQVLSRDLLPDGTDPLQSPGPPYVRRMWAGGSLQFKLSGFYPQNSLVLDGRRAFCIEKIQDVTTKGEGENEKVFVTIERTFSTSDAFEVPCTNSPSSGAECGLLEMRNLVFMKEKNPEDAKRDAEKPDRVVKPAHQADVRVPITPTQALLFRFSALTFNAHGIHLDRQYCREVEGRRNLLVHGPLSVVFMLSVLRGQLVGSEEILRFDYRNLAPLYADEEMVVCVREDKNKDLSEYPVSRKFEVWIEGVGGGYAVKGSAIVRGTMKGEKAPGEADMKIAPKEKMLY